MSDQSNCTSTDPIVFDAHPQDAPIGIPNGPGKAKSTFKVDVASCLGDLVVIAGWADGPVPRLDLWQDAEQLISYSTRTDRPDVARALALDDGCDVGFVLISATAPDMRPDISCSTDAGSHRFSLTYEEGLPNHGRRSLTDGIWALLSDFPIGSPLWRALLRQMPQTSHERAGHQGHIDKLCLSPGQGHRKDRGWCSGWVSHAQETVVWLEDSLGGVHDLTHAYRFARDDVRKNVTEIYDISRKPGFLTRILAGPGATAIGLCACSRDGVFRQVLTPAVPMPMDPLRAVEQLLEVETPVTEFPQRAREIDLPVLGAMRHRQVAEWTRQDCLQGSFGDQPENPRVSIIVPLFRRVDFVEHQLLEFRRDPGFAEDCELIYVVDDIEIEQQFLGLAGLLHQLCGPAFRWISAGGNRGFAGANNLGASIARAERLIFLNSDAFPTAPGWAGALCDVLDENPKVGMVGPRLLFPDGSLQHIGMEPYWHSALNLWTNRHPSMGMDPEDAKTGLTQVPLLTGACVALRKTDLDRVGGWNTDYLAGDFEDSDLCLRIAEAGLHNICLHDVSLIHLERQSFAHVGVSTLRQRITLLNAVAYNQRWANQLAGMKDRGSK